MVLVSGSEVPQTSLFQKSLTLWTVPPAAQCFLHLQCRLARLAKPWTCRAVSPWRRTTSIPPQSHHKAKVSKLCSVSRRSLTDCAAGGAWKPDSKHSDGLNGNQKAFVELNIYHFYKPLIPPDGVLCIVCLLGYYSRPLLFFKSFNFFIFSIIQHVSHF